MYRIKPEELYILCEKGQGRILEVSCLTCVYEVEDHEEMIKGNTAPTTTLALGFVTGHTNSP